MTGVKVFLARVSLQHLKGLFADVPGTHGAWKSLGALVWGILFGYGGGSVRKIFKRQGKNVSMKTARVKEVVGEEPDWGEPEGIFVRLSLLGPF